MKLIQISLAFLFIVIIGKELQRKLVSDSEFDYEFYVLLDEQENYRESIYYFWYKSSSVHSTLGSAGGELLHGEFKKFYKNSQLAEKGEFNSGMKTGEWKKWFITGEIKEIQNYFKGKQNGQYFSFDESGNIVKKGRLRNGQKTGRWIENKKDTLFYKKGKIFNKKKGFLKSEKFKNLFKKKEHKINVSKDRDSLNGSFFGRIKKLFKHKKNTAHPNEAEKIPLTNQK